MGERRYRLLLGISLFLVACSITLAVIGYNLYARGRQQPPAAIVAATPPTAPVMRDSLEALYSKVISNIDNNLSKTLTSTDSLKTDISAKLNDLNNLKAEIAVLLKDKTPNADLDLARQKIIELQVKVNQLTNRTMNVEEENRKLLALLQQLKTPGTNTSNAATVVNNKQPVAETTDNNIQLTATELHLLAVAVTNDKEQETTQADNTEKIIGSFTLKGLSQARDADIMVVVLQPDGKVLKNSPWESGMFETKEGKKIYSRKLHIDGSEPHQLSFSLKSDSYQKGSYTMQVYYNGQLIGRTAKTLS